MGPAESDLQFLSGLVRRRSGLHLEPERFPQVEFRLARVAQRFGFRHVAAMLRELRHEPEALAAAVTEAMTTNDTSFFRDGAPYVHFRERILPALLQARADARTLRIWCAAASTGQEPYSLAMILHEERAALKGWYVEVLATDINAEALARAREGLYSESEIGRGLSAEQRLRHFTQEEEGWRVGPAVRRLVDFRTFNLMDDFAWLGALDVILCRNALLYFDAPTKAAVLEKLAGALAPDGCLMLGAAESPRGATRLLSAAGHGFFVKARGTPKRTARLAS